jgi:adenylate kinase family enzyme
MAELTKEIEKKLSEPVPQSAIQTKQQGNSNIRFTSDKWVMSRLDEAVGVAGWSEHYTVTAYGKPTVIKEYTNHRTNEKVQTLSIGTITCDLTVLGVPKSSTIDIIVEPGSYGTPATNAQARVFKRAAMKFGIAAELWNKDEDVDEDEEDVRPAGRSSGSSKSGSASRGGSDFKTLSDGQIRWITKDVEKGGFGVPESVAKQIPGGPVGNKFIDALKSLKAEDEDEFEEDPGKYIKRALKQADITIASSKSKAKAVTVPADDDEDDDEDED